MIHAHRALLIFILSSFCIACGQKGPLYLPEKNAKPVAQNAELVSTIEDPTRDADLH